MSDPIPAASLEIQNCSENCQCQSVHLLLLDADGDQFATGCLSPAQARAVARDLISTADLAEARLARITGRQQ